MQHNRQLITELELLQRHLEQVETEITQIVENSREGKILLSIPGIGPVQAATIIASIGNIANFERASQLKSYFGWAPSVAQSGSTLHYERLTPRGQRQLTSPHGSSQGTPDLTARLSCFDVGSFTVLRHGKEATPSQLARASNSTGVAFPQALRYGLETRAFIECLVLAPGTQQRECVQWFSTVVLLPEALCL